MSLINTEYDCTRIFRRLSRLVECFLAAKSIHREKHVRETYADCAIAFNGNAEIASSPCLTATASGALVGSNVIADSFSRSPYVALDDIFGQARFPFSCFFLSAALPRQSRSRTSQLSQNIIVMHRHRIESRMNWFTKKNLRNTNSIV